MVVWGMRYILENYVMRQWSEEDVERADIFYRCVGVGGWVGVGVHPHMCGGCLMSRGHPCCGDVHLASSTVWVGGCACVVSCLAPL